jgi:inorganic triphosphatase YgiF
MASEVELKFAVPPAMLRALSGAAWLNRAGPARHDRLVSVYFDTGPRALRSQGLSLRVRHIGDRTVQTVKGPGDYRRQEWERDIDGEGPERDMARHTALKPFATKKKWRKLHPVFETEVGRTSFLVTSAKSRIEVALDRGKVRAGRHSQPISEVELELKKGEVADLSRLAKRIARRDGVTLELRSKAERGYALADRQTDDHVGASAIALEDDMTAAEGFRAIGFSCLHHLEANRAAVLNDDPEGIHQMRVGLRRLRAALSLFKPLIEGGELEAIKRDLKWVTGELGPARDFDIFVEQTVMPMEKHPPAGLAALETDLKARRHKGFVRAKRMVRSQRYRRILLKTGLWLTGGDWATGDDRLRRDLRKRKLKDMARDILTARTAKTARKLKKLDKLTAMQRHKLRIALKKLRYAVGFFESLFPRPGRFAARLKQLQDALGRLNDIQVHEKFARKTVRGKRQLPRGAYALGVVTAKEQAAVKPCLAAAAKAGKRFRAQRPFWK